MNLTPEDKAVGRENYYDAVGVNRRDFLKEIIAAGAVSGVGLGAMYFGYSKVADPVRVGVIGTGDEGCVLLGAMNPEYIQVKAIADIRPSSIQRAIHGDWASPAAIAARPGLMSVYGWKTEEEARQNVAIYTQDNGGYEALLQDPEIEAVVIALPLHLHAPVAIKAMLLGKHVLCEKLMAHNIAQCKAMGLVAEHQDVHLSTGHQRHYSILYDNAVNLINWGVLGQIHFIRAQWHRGNLPGNDSWALPIPGGEKAGDKVVDKIAADLANFQKKLKGLDDRVAQDKPIDAAEYDLLKRKAAQWEKWNTDQTVRAKEHGYEDMTLSDSRVRTALEELVRWRLWERTGGGLMVELGSHQLDAASIFISALRNRNSENKGKVHPLTVHAVGGRHIFPYDRDAADHVYCMFEFPGPAYEAGFDVGYKDVVSQVPGPDGIPAYENDPSKKIVVTYSSINGNGFGGYGEVVLGTKGTLILEREQEVMLFTDSSTSTRVGVTDDGGGPTMDTQASGEMGPVAKAAEPQNVSRGYREELEHWAWCIRNAKSPRETTVRCTPTVALGDAVIALTCNVAMNNSHRGKGGYIPFEEDWFDMHKAGTSDGSIVADELNAMIGGPLASELLKKLS
jgi:predicted dehydrogenase